MVVPFQASNYTCCHLRHAIFVTIGAEQSLAPYAKRRTCSQFHLLRQLWCGRRGKWRRCSGQSRTQGNLRHAPTPNPRPHVAGGAAAGCRRGGGLGRRSGRGRAAAGTDHASQAPGVIILRAFCREPRCPNQQTNSGCSDAAAWTHTLGHVLIPAASPSPVALQTDTALPSRLCTLSCLGSFVCSQEQTRGAPRYVHAQSLPSNMAPVTARLAPLGCGGYLHGIHLALKRLAVQRNNKSD